MHGDVLVTVLIPLFHDLSSKVTQLCLTLLDPMDPRGDHQAPLSMEFSRQEYWSGLPLPSPGYLPDPGIKPRSPALQADALPSEPPGKPSERKRRFIRITTHVKLWQRTTNRTEQQP